MKSSENSNENLVQRTSVCLSPAENSATIFREGNLMANEENALRIYLKHINRPKTKAMTAEINALLGYRPISIFTAREVLDYEQDDK
jgi:hypothetical protein